MATIFDLPIELVCMICTDLAATDIIHLFSICKTMHNYMAAEVIWADLCLRYGVNDTSVLGGGTFFHIYSGLLHTYGPLLGLWASDHPFVGDIIEFRLDTERQAIVGEAWDFRESRRREQPVMLPSYYTFLTIAPPPTDSASHHAIFQWRFGPRRGQTWNNTELRAQTNTAAFPTLLVLSESQHTLYIRQQFGSHLQPDFPVTTHDPWYDDLRGLPKLRVEESPTPYECPQSTYEGHLFSFIYMLPEGSVKPRALCIRPAQTSLYGIEDFYTPLRWHDRRLHWSDVRDINASRSVNGARASDKRYYPLRLTAQPVSAEIPSEGDWDPSSLEGLWLGDYDAHGVEVLWLTYDQQANVVQALKVTGDQNVPRGAISWRIDIGEEVPIDTQEKEHSFRRASPRRLYRGRGTVSPLGFYEEDTVLNLVGIVSTNTVVIEWTALDPGRLSWYRRYTQRDLAAETKPDPLLRVPPPILVHSDIA
ncbi:hypothetical protein BDW22DRAFT_1350773 [Trametopsis cervina]|nr:hypothetical protein BDW22DRAFT_1350773 [Trametopsis cervina]